MFPNLPHLMSSSQLFIQLRHFPRLGSIISIEIREMLLRYFHFSPISTAPQINKELIGAGEYRYLSADSNQSSQYSWYNRAGGILSSSVPETNLFSASFDFRWKA